MSAVDYHNNDRDTCKRRHISVPGMYSGSDSESLEANAVSAYMQTQRKTLLKVSLYLSHIQLAKLQYFLSISELNSRHYILGDSNKVEHEAT